MVAETLRKRDEAELTIPQVVARTGLTAHTLRYYERAGLLEAVVRNGGGHRRYRERDVDALRFLVRLRLTGMPIHQVREYVRLAHAGEATVPARHDLLLAHRRAVLERMAELERNLAVLDYKIDLYAAGWSYTTMGEAGLCGLRDLMENT